MKPKCRSDKEKEAKTLITSIVRTLKHPKADMPIFVFKKRLNKITGYFDEDTITLAIYNVFFLTLIHELIHYLHKDWKETKVVQSEKLLKHYLTMEDVKKILKAFGNLL